MTARTLVATCLILLGAASACQQATAIESSEAAAAPAVGAQAAADLDGFEPTKDYKLVIGEELDDDAAFMLSNKAAAVLVLTEKLPTSVVLNTRTQEVQKIDMNRVQLHADGSASVPGTAILGTVTKFVPGQRGAVFSYDGVLAKVELDLPEPLVGEKKNTDIYEHSPSYKVKAGNYNPDSGLISELKAFPRDARVQVVFGSWCHVCTEYMPNLMRVEEELAGSKITFDYLGIPDWDYPPVKRLQVTQLPTAIVYVEGKEVGRFAGGGDFRRVEKTLNDRLNK